MRLKHNNILKSKPIQVFNHGNMKRDFTYIDDIIAGTRLAINKNYTCELFNLGNHRSEELMDVVHLIEENLGKKAEIEFLPMQPGDILESLADIENSEEFLGFKPTTGISSGIEDFVEWYKEYNTE